MGWFWCAVNRAILPFFLVAACLLGGAVVCASSHAIPKGTPSVYAGIPPVAFLVERLGSPFVRVEPVAGPSLDPHVFEPTPRQILKIKKSRALFIVGLPFERALGEELSKSEPGPKIVKLFKEPLLEEDPHVWLSPTLLKGMAKDIALALESLVPERSQEFQERLKNLLEEIERLRLNVQAQLAPYRGRSFLAYHGAFAHFAAEFGLNQLAVELEGKELTPKRLSEVIERARKERVSVLIAQPQFDPSRARLVAQALNARIAVINPMDGDVFRTIRSLGSVLSEALGGSHGR